MMEDTTPTMAQKYREMMQAKTPEERFKMGCSMYDTSRYLVTQGILARNPGISKLDLRREVFLSFYKNDFTPLQLQKILEYLERRWRIEDRFTEIGS